MKAENRKVFSRWKVYPHLIHILLARLFWVYKVLLSIKLFTTKLFLKFGRPILTHLLSFLLIFNPVLISTNVYANIPTQNTLNDGHVSNLNPHLETTAGAMRIDGTTNTGLDRAQNQVPIVNIATPSNAGVSKNNFTDFNVGTEGAIMNNSNQIATSQLGGAIYANPNLAPNQDARIILNEVTSTRTSNIYGPTEIHGRAAEYILANPNGITCKGCEFINAPRVSLITGNSVMQNGDVSGFNVSQNGEVLVETNGLFGVNAWNEELEHFDIITRVAKINAEIYANNLTIKTGNDYFDYQTKEITSTNNGSPKPIVVIDSSILGGMYGGRIVMESSESGVGINLGGNAIADASSLEITADGNIVYAGIASINNTVSVTSNNGSITQNAFTSSNENTTITAKNTVTLNGNCTAELGGNCVNSGNNTTIKSSSLQNNTNIVANQTLNIEAEQTIINQGNIAANSVEISSTLLQNDGMILSANNTDINSNEIANSEITNSGQVISFGNLNLTASLLNNSGSLASQNTLTAVVDDLTNTGTISTNNTNILASSINNSLGEISSQTDTTLITNTLQNGTIISGNNTDIFVNETYEITGNLQTNNNLSITSNGNITNKTNLETGNETTISTTQNF